jgi:hypothetical protein
MFLYVEDAAKILLNVTIPTVFGIEGYDGLKLYFMTQVNIFSFLLLYYFKRQ